eukprot:1319108-Amorphochlora_amoeboformis.AAC.1
MPSHAQKAATSSALRASAHWSVASWGSGSGGRRSEMAMGSVGGRYALISERRRPGGVDICIL